MFERFVCLSVVGLNAFAIPFTVIRYHFDNSVYNLAFFIFNVLCVGICSGLFFMIEHDLKRVAGEELDKLRSERDAALSELDRLRESV